MSASRTKKGMIAAMTCIKTKTILAAVLAIIFAAYFCSTAYAASTSEVRVLHIDMQSTMTVRVNQQRILIVYYSPNNATGKSVEWSSSDEDVVLVGSDGMLTGVSPGTAIITAITPNEKSATCVVTVPGKVSKAIDADVGYTQHPEYTGDSAGPITTADLRADVDGAIKKARGKLAVLSYDDQFKIQAASLRSAAYVTEYREGIVSLQFNTRNEKGGIQGRLTIDPALAKDLSADISPGIYTDSDNTGSLKKTFEKLLSTPVAVIRCAQDGSYGMMVDIAAKLDLSGLDTKALRFYSYDRTSNTYKLIENMAYSIDKNGYLHIKTDFGGVYIITN